MIQGSLSLFRARKRSIDYVGKFDVLNIAWEGTGCLPECSLSNASQTLT